MRIQAEWLRSAERQAPALTKNHTARRKHTPMCSARVALGIWLAERTFWRDPPLGLSIHERCAKAAAIADLIDTPSIVLLGDFNDWVWVKSVRRVLARHCPATTRLRRFPARLPLLRLDRIYAGSSAQIVRAQTDYDARLYSDHLAVLADVALLEKFTLHSPQERQ